MVSPIKLNDLTLKIKGFAGTQTKQQVFETNYQPDSKWRGWTYFRCGATEEERKSFKKPIGREMVRLRCWPKKYARNGIDTYHPKSQKEIGEMARARNKTSTQAVKASGLNAKKFTATLGQKFKHLTVKIPAQLMKDINVWEYEVRYRVKRLIVFGVATGPGGFEAEFELIIPIQITWEVHYIKPCGMVANHLFDQVVTQKLKHSEETIDLIKRGLEFENGLTEALKKAAEEHSKKLSEGG